MKRTRGALLTLVLLFHGAGYAMTSAELIGSLKKAGAEEAEVLEAFPLEIEEKQHDFLGSGVHLRVSALDPHHPHLLHYVAGPKGKVYRLKLGQAEIEQMRSDLKLEIKDRDQALRYAQWLLEVTEGPALWLVSKADEVPFQPVGEGEEELASEIAKAKKDLATKIAAPSAKTEKDGFVVTQDAVKGIDLVRYEVAVSPAGRSEVKQQTLVADLPVVYVLGD